MYNAVKKQHGFHVHLLNLSLERSATPIPIIPLPPQLPLPNTAHPPFEVPDTSELWMSEGDAQATGKFVREFVTQSLLPWMEKNVLEWNEAVGYFASIWIIIDGVSVCKQQTTRIATILVYKKDGFWLIHPDNPYDTYQWRLWRVQPYYTRAVSIRCPGASSTQTFRRICNLLGGLQGRSQCLGIAAEGRKRRSGMSLI